MSRRSRSPAAAPNAKRQRTQSPEIEFPELSQAEIEVFEMIEASQSQRISGLSQSVQLDKEKCSVDSDESMHEISSDDPFGPDAPTKTVFPSFTSAAMFTSAASLPVMDEPEPSSSQPPPEPDYDSWFDNKPLDDSVGFQSAASFTTGFQTASKGIIAPSAEAIAKAQALLREWDDDGEEDAPAETSQPLKPLPPPTLALFQTASSLAKNDTPSRPALRPVRNVPDTPQTPTPAPSSHSSVSSISLPPFAASLKAKPKAFKSPLMKPPPLKSAFSPASVSQNIPPAGAATPVRPKHPLSNAPVTAPLYASPKSSNPPTHPKPTVLRGTPAKFVTPFKPGMRPGEPGHTKLIQKATNTPSVPSFAPASSSRLANPPRATLQKPAVRSVFNLVKPPDRQRLADCGALPRWSEPGDSELPQSIVRQLEQMHPSLAPYYSFFGPALDKSRDPSAQDVQIGPSAAFERMQAAGCSLATQEWVDNHWSLILWKLAGLAYLQPEREWYDDQKRWCWDEVNRQLLYRYERELNQGVRPPLRLIATQDAPSVSPMVLCISDIIWLPQTSRLDGKLNERVAELEVTDGWYKIRAQIDAPLMRAVTKGTLKVGRKIAVVNAKLDSERKDPQEILEAYGSIKLVLTGNSSHLAPWHAKLGFQRDLPIATMSSLTRDGGMIAAMDLVIVKTFPIAYFEFVYKGDKKVNNGPLNEQEEARLRDQWQRKRENEHSKLRENLDKTARRYTGYAERLERKAGSSFRPSEAGPPDRIDDLYDQLEEPEDAVNVISQVSCSDAGWLAMRIRQQTEKQQETMSEEIEKELNDICPPRDVRSFRVIVVKDAQSNRRPANREAQLTVWDVLNVYLSEGRRAGTFEVGECCRVTHLQPTQPSAWMDNSPGAQIFMSTTRNTRWTKLKMMRHEV